MAVEGGRPCGTPLTVSRRPGAAPILSTARARSGEFRPDIEGMRAIAVIAVLLFHVQIPGFGGGFIGVDVFNVISGFLITGLLVREMRIRDTIDLPRFYFRRVRRLLPAGLLVIVLTLIASAVILSPIRFPSVAGDGAASALYVANIRFAAAGTDYLASAADPSPYQHYWSLAVEEQFYLVWPLLILVVSRMIGVRRVGFVLAGVVIASFLFSLYLTDMSAPWAFFSLPTRAWELGAGGLVAIGIASRLPKRALPYVGVLGLALVLAGVFLINEFDALSGYRCPGAGAGHGIHDHRGERRGRLVGPGTRIARAALHRWHLLLAVPVALAAAHPGAHRARQRHPGATCRAGLRGHRLRDDLHARHRGPLPVRTDLQGSGTPRRGRGPGGVRRGGHDRHRGRSHGA